jgi:hypothetical protein
MKKYTAFKRMGIIFLLSLFSMHCFSQHSTVGFDSIAVTPDKKKRLYFNVEYPPLQEISLKINPIKREKITSNSIFGDMGRNIIASIIGSWTVGKEMDFILPCELRSSVPDMGWNIFMYVQGQKQKSYEKTRDTYEGPGNGSSTQNKLYWEKGAWGILVDRKDTIAKIVLSIDPLHDSVLMAVAKELIPEKIKTKEGEKKKEKFSLLYPPENWRKMGMVDYGIFGVFKEHNMLIIYGVEAAKGWIFWNSELQAVFKDQENPDTRRPSFSTAPFVLLRPQLNEQDKADLIRIAMFCKLMEESLYNYKIRGY